MKTGYFIIAAAALAGLLAITACENAEEPDEPAAQTVSKPTAVPDSRKLPVGSSVTLSTATRGADIYYTTDGSEPTTSSLRYVEPILIGKNHIVLEAIAVLDGASSDTAYAVYTSDADLVEEMAICPMPSPMPGGVPAGTIITLTTATPGADIYYTTDGSDPMLSSTRSIAASPPVITFPTTLKAYAEKKGMHNSSVLTGYYSVSEQPEEADPYPPPPGGPLNTQILTGSWWGGMEMDDPFGNMTMSREMQQYLDIITKMYTGSGIPSDISFLIGILTTFGGHLTDTATLLYDYDTVLNEYTDWVEPNGQFTLSINDVEQTAIQNSITLGLEASLGLKVEGFSASLTASIKDTSSTTFTTIRGKTVTQSWDLTKFDQAYKYKVVLVGRLKVISHDTKVDQSHISGLGGVIDTTWVDQTSLTWRLVHN